MIRFLTKGILRDRSRSLFPVLVVSLTVSMIIFFKGFTTGIMNGFFRDTAVIATGHLKVMTRAYNKESQLFPIDLAFLETDKLIENLTREYPNYFWTPRIIFPGLLDIPDKHGETLKQGPTLAYGIDFFSSDSRQIELWDLDRKLTKGKLPQKMDEVLLSTKLANRLGINVGQKITFIGSTMHGAFTTFNFIMSGTFSLNMGPIDKQMMLLDISGARLALDMGNASSEVLGFTHSLYYKDQFCVLTSKQYNNHHSDSADTFSPIMLALRESNQMGTMVDINNAVMAILLGVFMTIVMIVLWNMGIMNGLRRYGEIGLRLAIGESKPQVFRSMILEAIIIGSIGTVLGTTVGVGLTYYLQEVGLDYSQAFDKLSSSSFIMSNIFYAKVTPDLYYIGFFPGVLATVIGTMFAGRAIYKREMSQLFKELES